MRTIITLFAILFITNFAHADDFELTVYFDLSAAEQHDIIKCPPGGEELNTEYHLTVFKDKPSYTLLGNLDFDKNVAGDIKKKLLCDQGEFTLRKTIHSDKDTINIFIYLEEIYLIKDEIFNIATVKLSANEDYFIQKKYINESVTFIVRTTELEKNTTTIKYGDLIYRIELKRK